MVNQPSVSVVIVSFYTGPILSRTIDSVLQQSGLHEIILVDNGNSADVRERLYGFAKKKNNIKILSGQGNVGFAAGCNLGAKNATGDYVLLLNPDCLLPRDALKKTVAEMEKDPDVWLAGCRMIKPDGTLQGGSKRNLLTPHIAFSQALRLRYFGNFKQLNIEENEEETESSYVPAISGAFMMMKKDKYDKVGGLDEEYFFHVEDLDLCKNINKLGGKILYIPSVKTIHYRSSSKVSGFFVEWHKKNGFISYFKKHYRNNYRYGLFYFIILGIYFRLFLKILPLSIGGIIAKRKSKVTAEKEKRQLALLEKPMEPYSEEILSDEDKKNSQPVLLSGSTGQVGLNIIRRLLANDIKTYALYHNQVVDHRHSKLKWIQGDLSSEKLNLKSLLYKTPSPKTLIHTPAIWLLPKHLDELADLGVNRIICFSSTSIVSKSASENKYEQELIKKFITAEEQIAKKCEELKINWTIYRPTMIYGSGLDRNISSIVRFIETFGFFPVAKPGKGLRQPVHADDLADAVLRSINLEKTYNKTYNLAGKTKITYFDMVGRIFKIMGKKEKTITSNTLPFLLDAFSFVSGRKDINGEIAKRMNNDLVFDYVEAKNDFGFNPREFLSAEKSDLGFV